MYTGTMIRDLMRAAERVLKKPTRSSREVGSRSNITASGPNDGEQVSEPEKLPQSLGLGAADRDLGLFLVVHP